MKVDTLKYILDVDDNTFKQINDEIINSDTRIGKIYFEGKGLLFDLGIYSYYPLLFQPFFDCGKDLKNIILFSRYYTGWLFILDKLYDDANEYMTKELLVMSTILSEAEHILGNIAALRNQEIYEQICMFRSVNDITMLKEKNYFSYKKEFDDKELFDYCKDKYVIAKMVVYICYVCSGSCDTEILEKLYYSHDCYAIGRQILDEIDDYEEDYVINKFNIYAYKLLKMYNDVREEDIIKISLMQKAEYYFSEAIAVVESLPNCGWKRFLEINEKKLNGKGNQDCGKCK